MLAFLSHRSSRSAPRCLGRYRGLAPCLFALGCSLEVAGNGSAKPVLNRLRNRVDNRRYNGAALLGLRGVVIKSHGSADAYAFGFALQRAREAVVSKLLERTAQTVAQINQRVQSASVEAQPPEMRIALSARCSWPMAATVAEGFNLPEEQAGPALIITPARSRDMT